MKRKIILLLFILNTLVLLVYYLPLLQVILHISFDQNAGAVSIIGGADGPTAIYIASQINWFPIIIFSLEILFGVGLLLSRPKI